MSCASAATTPIRCYPFRSGNENYRVCESAFRVTFEALGRNKYDPDAVVPDFVAASLEGGLRSRAFSSPDDPTFRIQIASDDRLRGVSLSGGRPSGRLETWLPFADRTVSARLAAIGDPGGIARPGRVEAGLSYHPTLGMLDLDFSATGHIFVAPPVTNGSPALNVRNPGFAEFGAQVSHTFVDDITIGAALTYSPNWLGRNSDAFFASLKAKYLLDETVFPAGLSISGELGRNTLGPGVKSTSSAQLPQYMYWNVGLTYRRDNAAVDLRYNETGLDAKSCAAVLGGQPGSSNSGSCGASFVATLSFDLGTRSLRGE